MKMVITNTIIIIITNTNYTDHPFSDDRRREGGSGHSRNKSLHATETYQVRLIYLGDDVQKGKDDDDDDD